MSSSKESEDEKLKRVASTSDGVEGVEDLPLPSSSAVRLVLKPWRVRFWDQLTILIYKQTLVYARNLRSTLLRLLAPFFFMFLLWLLNLAVQANSVAYDALVNVPAPSVETVASIPDCSTDTFIKGFPCYDFIYSPNNSKTVGTVVDGMRNNNPGRVIPSSAVLGFASIEDANSWLLGNPESVIGGVHFLLNEPAAGSTLNYVLQVNSTTKYFKNRYQDPTFYAALPLQAAAERELARMATNGILKSWNASVSQFAHPTVGDLNIVGKTLGPFIFAANMFNFVLLVSPRFDFSVFIENKSTGSKSNNKSINKPCPCSWLQSFLNENKA